VHSEEFRTWWADHRVVERRDGIKRLDHPLVGRIDVFYEALDVTGEADQTLFIYSTEPESESESKLRELADRTRRIPPMADHSTRIDEHLPAGRGGGATNRERTGSASAQRS
jgi:hypothetical protein